MQWATGRDRPNGKSWRGTDDSAEERSCTTTAAGPCRSTCAHRVPGTTTQSRMTSLQIHHESESTDESQSDALASALLGDSACAIGEQVDLEAVLAAWHTATLRLERTHETLCGEVARLTNELEIKNRELARKNRLADLGQMASHVAHEVRNNLVPVSLYMSLLRRRLASDPDNLGVLERIERGFTALDAVGV